MEKKGQIVKFDIGRENIVVLPDQVPPETRSPFEDGEE
jgi:hypothetical protein